jgi:hypothetical protein
MTPESMEGLIQDGVSNPDVEFGKARRHWNNRVPGKWAHLCRLHDLPASAHFKKRSGVYRIVALTAELAPTPAALDRLCCPDQTGTLYVGKAAELRSRLGQIERAMRSPSDRRRPIRYYEEHAVTRLRHPLLAKNFPPNRLAITWAFDLDPGKAESKLFHLYLNSFGECPPLNRSF